MKRSTSGGRYFEAGDMVFGRPVIGQLSVTRRKGIVLGPANEAGTMVRVWWYRLGFASDQTTTSVWGDTLTPAGTVFDLGYRMARELTEACSTYNPAEEVADMVGTHAFRMRRDGALFPVKEGS